MAGRRATPLKGALDTQILRLANLHPDSPRSRRHVARRRFSIIKKVHDGKAKLLLSPLLVKEYESKIPRPLNDFVSWVLEITTQNHGGSVEWNWVRQREIRVDARKCRFPSEDYTLLRTAKLQSSRSYILTEERRQLRAARCCLRRMNIDIREEWP